MLQEMINPIAVAIPGFFLLLAVEWWVARRRQVKVFRFADAITNLMCGLTSQAAGVFTAVLGATAYLYVFEHAALFELTAEPWLWVVTFIVVDVIYYAWHRFTHEVAIGWITHVVHHQSEDYNLAVALRQSFTSSLSTIPFFLPLALFGVPPAVAALCIALNTLYQFWIHTELIGRLGPLEWVLNTPSHHRVHHGINPQYLDKNYAGVFIVWDRLFGTFAREEEQVVYGTVAPLRSWNPVWANVWYAVLLGKKLFGPRGAQVAFRSPAFDPVRGEHVTPLPVSRETRDKFQTPVSAPLIAYQAVHFLLVTTTLIALLTQTLSLEIRIASASFIFAAGFAFGGLIERKRWALPLELVRVGAMVPLGLALVGVCAPRASAVAPYALGVVAMASVLVLSSSTTKSSSSSRAPQAEPASASAR